LVKAVNILNDIENLLFPKLCFGCLASLKDLETTVCTYCRHEMPLTYSHLTRPNAVEKVFFGRAHIQRADALFWYEKAGIVQNIIHCLKYKGAEEVGVFAGNWLGNLLLESKSYQDIDLVVPVPLHPHKKRKRGYNQVSLFGAHIAQNLNVPFREDLLIRLKKTSSQTRKDRVERDFSRTQLFSCPQPDLSDVHVLLVDDVLTTGATLENCANTLLSLKNVKVSIATMAITV